MGTYQQKTTVSTLVMEAIVWEQSKQPGGLDIGQSSNDRSWVEPEEVGHKVHFRGIHAQSQHAALAISNKQQVSLLLPGARRQNPYHQMSVRIGKKVLDGHVGKTEGLVTNSKDRPTIGRSNNQRTPGVVLGRGNPLLQQLSGIYSAGISGVGLVP